MILFDYNQPINIYNKNIKERSSLRINAANGLQAS